MSDWSEIEVELTVADYFQMLQAELRGSKYNKTLHRNNLKPLLNNRDKAIEFKHQNISAILIKYGYPYIKGYKPLPNYQQLLEEKVIIYLSQHLSLEKDFTNFSNAKLEIQKTIIQYKNWNVTPPDRTIIQDPKANIYKPLKRNYLELEQNNRSIGETGEKLVFEYEQWRLNSAGLPKLAKEVKWVSKESGDGAGFDILSKNIYGMDIYIEVKTTTLGKETPIFFSKNENDFSDEKKDAFNLYRIFDLRNQPKMFLLNGRFQDICSIEATNFKGTF